jgi:hypothetical protein
MLLQARVEHLLSLPASTPLGMGALADKTASGSAAGSGEDKENARTSVWDGFSFTVPSFHSTVFWDCKLLGRLTS